MNNILEVKGLSKEYKSFKLNDISFSIPSGTIMGLIGENGAGKSTTIKGILNLIKRDSGHVKIFGEEMVEGKDNLRIKERIGVVFDKQCFNETLTPKQVGKILKPLYPKWSDAIYFKHLKSFDIPEDKTLKEFSKGMEMKFSIAAALAQQPDLLILDEPTSGLDPISREDILGIFLDFVQDETKSILFSSHITTDLEKVADYITFISKGELTFSQSKDELIYDYGLVRCGETEFNSMDKDDILFFRKKDYQYEVLVHNKEDIKLKYRDLDKFIVDKTNLDEIMLMHVRGEKLE